MADTFFGDRNIQRDELALADWEIELASIPTKVARLSAVARLDAFLTSNSFAFVEINGKSPAGPARSKHTSLMFEWTAPFRTRI